MQSIKLKQKLTFVHKNDVETSSDTTQFDWVRIFIPENVFSCVGGIVANFVLNDDDYPVN